MTDHRAVLVGGPHDGRELDASEDVICVAEPTPIRFDPSTGALIGDPTDPPPTFATVRYEWDGTITTFGTRRYVRLRPPGT
jgi:hypothetical protein